MTEEQQKARTARLSDPTAMRALAHPVRLRLLGELRTHGPQSVKMLGDALDEPPGSISYHVGKLAGIGLVEEAPELARDRRERWWRAAHDTTSWEPVEALDDPERRAASGALRRAVAAGYAAGLERYFEAEPALDRAWARGTAIGDALLHLTSDELQELNNDIEALVGRWQARSAAARAGAEPVTFVYQAFRRP
jgi:DNA-binding transcriptional ArsR family regulator